MNTLETMQQHGPVVFIKYVPSNLDDSSGRDADHVAVECGVMQLAQGKTVGHQGHSAEVCVRNDMCSIQQLTMAQVTN
jgi:hypothetical protein